LNPTRACHLLGVGTPRKARLGFNKMVQLRILQKSSALMDALREATRRTQIIVTSHSPDLINEIDLNSDKLVAVQNTRGNTEIGVVDPASQEAIRRHLYSPGELLRMDQLEIDRTDLLRQKQLELFETAEAKT